MWPAEVVKLDKVRVWSCRQPKNIGQRTSQLRTATKESMAETKPATQIFETATLMRDEFDELLYNFDLWKTLKICWWISQPQLIQKSRKQRQKKNGPLTTEEIYNRRYWWIKRVKVRNLDIAKFCKDQERLHLLPDEPRVLKCYGSIQSDYLLGSDVFTEKIV